nr:GNAT family N-acetyltransferase [Acinetobacter sp. BY419]
MKTRKGLASPIKTDRLNLRKFQTGDENSLFTEYFGDWESSKYLQRMPHKNISQTKNMLENWCGANWENPSKDFAWIISNRKSGLALGIVLFFNKDNYGEIHFGLGKNFKARDSCKKH